MAAGNSFARLRQNRGHLLTRKAGKITITATGRDDWIGWVELKTEPVNELATQHTAAVINDVDAQIQAVVFDRREGEQVLRAAERGLQGRGRERAGAHVVDDQLPGADADQLALFGR